MDKTNKPLVSIIMATYNRADQLDLTIKNIFEQSYHSLELVIINDGSTDGTNSTLQHLQKTFDFIIINNTKNLGLQKSLNIGINQATGKYIARIDDHDKWLDTDKLSKQVSFLESNPKIGIVGTGYKTGEKTILNPLTDSDIRNQILMRSPFCHVSVLIVKSILDQVGGYNETLSYSEDWELWLKIGKHAQLANLPDISVAIQEEDISLSGEYFLKQLPVNRQIVKQYYKDYPMRIRAILYHQFLRFFFAIFPLNGGIHHLMQRVFLKSFALTTKNNAFNESTF